MAIRKIVQLGDEVLRKKCFPVTDFGAKTRALSGKFDPEKDSGVINLL